MEHKPWNIWALSRENPTLLYENNKSADLPVHPRSLISAFIVRFMTGTTNAKCRYSDQSQSLSNLVKVLLDRKPRVQISRDKAQSHVSKHYGPAHVL